MPTSLEIKLRTAAALDATLSSLLGSSPFRWYGPQSPQGPQNGGPQFPLVEVMQVSQIPQYSTSALLKNALYRMQFTIWDIDLESCRAVKNAIIQFLVNFNAYSSPGNPNQTLQPNRVMNARLGKSEAQTAPITYWITVDVMIWNNESV